MGNDIGWAEAKSSVVDVGDAYIFFKKGKVPARASVMAINFTAIKISYQESKILADATNRVILKNIYQVRVDR